MKKQSKPQRPPLTSQLPRCRTGIQGLDEITGGGLPLGRPTLACGGAGCGKTLLAAEFLVRGAIPFGEPGVFMSFEETESELQANVASLAFDLADLAKRQQILVDHVHLERSEIHETGDYDLEGLFVRLNYAIDSIGAKRVVLDTLEALFASLPNEAVLRAELRRLFRWLKEKGVTAVITAERGHNQLTRHGLEEYVSDCVTMCKEIAAFAPHVVIVDPITRLMDMGTTSESKGMVTRLIDYLKAGQVTSLVTSLTHSGQSLQSPDASMSSLMDAWLLLQDFEGNGERNRLFYVLELKREALERKINGLRADYEIEAVELRRIEEQVLTRSLVLSTERAASGLLRQADEQVPSLGRTHAKAKHPAGNGGVR